MPTLPFYAWVAYYPDWSSFVIFAGELAALRHAAENHMEVVKVLDGQDPRDAASKKREVAS